jgi:hypothetical protein
MAQKRDLGIASPPTRSQNRSLALSKSYMQPSHGRELSGSGVLRRFSWGVTAV